METAFHFEKIFIIYRGTAGNKINCLNDRSENGATEQALVCTCRHCTLMYISINVAGADSQGLTLFSTTALVLDNVAVIERLQNLYLLYPDFRHMPIVLFQGLHRHTLPSPVIVWVVKVQNDLSKVTLGTEKIAVLIILNIQDKKEPLIMRYEDSPSLINESLSGSVYGKCWGPCQGEFHREICQDLCPEKKKNTRSLHILRQIERLKSKVWVKTYFLSSFLWALWAHRGMRASPKARRSNTCWWSWQVPGRLVQQSGAFADRSVLSVEGKKFWCYN